MNHLTFTILLFLLVLIGCKENTLELYDEEFIPEEIAYLHVIKNVDLQKNSTLKAAFYGEPDPDYCVAKSQSGECCTYDPYYIENNKFMGKDTSGNPIQFHLLISSRELEFITSIEAEEFIKIPPQAQDSILSRLAPTAKSDIYAVYVGSNRELNVRIDQIREITKHAPGDIIKYLDDTLEKVR
jgi:hypothetical protein